MPKRRKSTRRRSSAAHAAPRARKSSKRKSSRRRSKPTTASYENLAFTLIKGMAGAVLVTKAGDMVPITDPFWRNVAIAGGAIVLGVNMPEAIPFALGAGIAAGVKAATIKMPTLLNGIGRYSSGNVRMMERAAEDVRRGINGTGSGRHTTLGGSGTGRNTTLGRSPGLLLG